MAEIALWIVTALLVLTLLGSWVLAVQIVRQQGRLLLRIEALEESGRIEGDLEEVSPLGVAEGERLPPFSLRDLGGTRFELGDFAGRKMLLVNWSPDCGFCELIASDLAKLAPELARRRTELVLAAHGTPKRIRAFHDEHGLEATVLSQEDAGIDAFDSLGTPVAYLLDERGRVARPLAFGADEVLDLARQAAGRTRLATERPLATSRIERQGLEAGTPAPGFTLPDLDGRTVSLAEFRGRKVLLVFSDPDCGPCEELAPDLVRLHREHADNNLAVLMVSRADPRESHRKALEHGFEFPVVVQKRWKLSKQYGIFATPVAFLIDEEGVIARDVAIGADQILALAGEGAH